MNDKFIINKSLLNEFTLTIKQQDSTLPMVISTTPRVGHPNGDEFTGHLYLLDTNVEVDAGIVIAPTPYYGTGDGGVVTGPFYDNGKITLTFNSTKVGALISQRGSKADRYYLKPTYRLAIECETVNNGDFVAKVDNVYVDA